MLGPPTCDVKTKRRIKTANGKLHMAILSINEKGSKK